MELDLCFQSRQADRSLGKSPDSVAEESLKRMSQPWMLVTFKRLTRRCYFRKHRSIVSSYSFSEKLLLMPGHSTEGLLAQFLSSDMTLLEGFHQWAPVVAGHADRWIPLTGTSGACPSGSWTLPGVWFRLSSWLVPSPRPIATLQPRDLSVRSECGGQHHKPGRWCCYHGRSRM